MLCLASEMTRSGAGGTTSSYCAVEGLLSPLELIEPPARQPLSMSSLRVVEGLLSPLLELIEPPTRPPANMSNLRAVEGLLSSLIELIEPPALVLPAASETSPGFRLLHAAPVAIHTRLADPEGALAALGKLCKPELSGQAIQRIRFWLTDGGSASVGFHICVMARPLGYVHWQSNGQQD